MGSIVRPFDPWRNPLCTCPLKYSLNPYTGCAHSCSYCYISSYIPRAFKPRPKDEFKIARDISGLERGAIIAMSNSSDPYTPPEGALELTRRILERLFSEGFKVLITTKSPLVVRDLDLLARNADKVVVQITITTLDENLAKALEPRAPSPIARLKAVEKLASAGVPVSVRLDPIVPYVNDSRDNVDEVVEKAAEAGARHIVSSVYKAKPDNFARIIESFPRIASKLRELYKRGTYFRGQRYAPREYSLNILKYIKERVEEKNMQFTVCREEFIELNTPGTYCDGSHLFSKW